MNKIIIVKNPDGSCSITHPMPAMFDRSSRDRLELHYKNLLNLDASEQEVMDFVISRSQLQGKEYRIADIDSIPMDRTFRAAWTDHNPTETVDVDITKAKEIHKNKLRELRKPILDALDIEYMRALENNDPTDEIIIKKNKLRDITKLALPDTLDALKAYIPEILK